MKFLCVGCNRLLDVERFRIDAGVLVVTCTGCGAENRAGQAVAPAAAVPLAREMPLRTPTAEAIATAAVAANDQAFEVPAGHCPKCISRRVRDALACPSCGLVFAQSPGGGFQPSEWLKGEWLQLLQAWGDEGRHEALRSEAMTRAELAELGRLYRLRLAGAKEDPYAKRGLEEVLRLAVLPQVSLKQLKGGEAEVPKWKYIALSAIIVGCLVALFILVRQMLTVS